MKRLLVLNERVVRRMLGGVVGHKRDVKRGEDDRMAADIGVRQVTSAAKTVECAVFIAEIAIFMGWRFGRSCAGYWFRKWPCIDVP